MARVIVGVVARRLENGSFLPSEPIYKDVQKPKNEEKSYIPLDDLAAIFADKFKSYKKRNVQI